MSLCSTTFRNRHGSLLCSVSDTTTFNKKEKSHVQQVKLSKHTTKTHVHSHVIYTVSFIYMSKQAQLKIKTTVKYHVQ